jgi:outer membrane assembly lipoprotein YfiO
MTKLLRVTLVVAMLLPVVATSAQTADWVFKDGRWVRAAKPDEGTPAGQIALIRRRIDDGKERKAISLAKKFLEQHPDSPLREEAMMLAGRAEFRREHYYQAYEWYEKQLDNYPNGEYFQRAINREYEIAEAFLGGAKRISLGIFRLPAKEEGLMILRRITEHAPATKLARRAQMRIADHHYDNRNWDEAVEAYDQYLELYPKSEGARQAMLRAAQARFDSYRGPRWDDTPLVEAETRFTQFLTAHPGPASRHGVRRTLDTIEVLRAEKLHHTARFYERVGRKSPAVFYYRKTIDRYPDTEWADAARGRLGKLGADVEPDNSEGEDE